MLLSPGRAPLRAGIVTETTKAALEKAEAAKRELEQELASRTEGLERITAFLPRAADRFGELVRNLAAVAQQDVARAREHVAALLGGTIKLAPAGDGFLEAELAGDYAATLRLAGQVSRVAGERNQLYRTSIILQKPLRRADLDASRT